MKINCCHSKYIPTVRVFKYNICKTRAIIERILTNACNAIRNSYACKVSGIIECIIADADSLNRQIVVFRRYNDVCIFASSDAAYNIVGFI